MVLLALRMFSLKRCILGAAAAPVRVLDQNLNGQEIMCCFRNGTS